MTDWETCEIKKKPYTIFPVMLAVMYNPQKSFYFRFHTFVLNVSCVQCSMHAALIKIP